MELIMDIASVWIICGVALFIFFVYTLQLAEERAASDPELIPLIHSIYLTLESVGLPGLLAACLLLWPKAVYSMLKKKLGRS